MPDKSVLTALAHTICHLGGRLFGTAAAEVNALVQLRVFWLHVSLWFLFFVLGNLVTVEYVQCYIFNLFRQKAGNALINVKTSYIDDIYVVRYPQPSRD